MRYFPTGNALGCRIVFCAITDFIDCLLGFFLLFWRKFSTFFSLLVHQSSWVIAFQSGAGCAQKGKGKLSLVSMVSCIKLMWWLFCVQICCEGVGWSRNIWTSCKVLYNWDKYKCSCENYQESAGILHTSQSRDWHPSCGTTALVDPLYILDACQVLKLILA
jgi:hypothetical protein